jgi:hypothetical protein
MVLLGAMTTVAVSWGLAALLPHRHLTIRHNVVQSTDSAGTLRYVAVFEFRRTGMIRLMWQPGIHGTGWPVAKGELRKESTIQLRPRVTQDRSWGNLPAALLPGALPSSGMEDARGWPLPALWCSLDPAAIDGASGTPPVIGGFRLSRPGTSTAQFRALPLMLIWRNFVLDSAAFAAAWCLAVGVFVLLRARWRRARDLCPRCAYSLTGNGVHRCPECGWNTARSIRS